MTIKNSLCRIIVGNRDQKYQNILHKGSLVLITSLVQFHDPWGSSLQSLPCRLMTNDSIFAPEPPLCSKKNVFKGDFVNFFDKWHLFYVLHVDVGFNTQN